MTALNFVDKELICVDCGGAFLFSAGEQMFFHDKGFKSEPKRCKACMAVRHSGRKAIVQTQIKCATCGSDAVVPFLPRRNEPVLCRTCFLDREKTTKIVQMGKPPLNARSR